MYITTESPQVSSAYPEPTPYEYEEIEVHPGHSTTPAPELHTVRVTTFAPDRKYLQKIKDASVHKYAEAPRTPSVHTFVEYPQALPDLHSSSLSEVLTKLQNSNHIPETLTADNVDNSIKTLVKILNNIKHNEIVEKPPPPPREYSNHANDDYDYANYGNDDDGKVLMILMLVLVLKVGFFRHG